MTTKLEVMNHMLSVIGEAPITNVNSNHPSALAASVQIDKLAKEIQSIGWWFNKEYAFPLMPELSTGYIVLPENTLDIDPCDIRSVLVQRGSRLYDPVTHSFNIGETIYVDIVVELDIEDLPELAAAYLKAKCAKDFYVNDDGDKEKADRLTAEEMKAWAFLKQAQLQNSDVNSKNRPTSAWLRSRIWTQTSSRNPRWPGGR